MVEVTRPVKPPQLRGDGQSAEWSEHTPTTPPQTPILASPPRGPFWGAPRGAPPQRELREAIKFVVAAWRIVSTIGASNRLPNSRAKSHPGALREVISEVISPGVHLKVPDG